MCTSPRLPRPRQVTVFPKRGRRRVGFDLAERARLPSIRRRDPDAPILIRGRTRPATRLRAAMVAMVTWTTTLVKEASQLVAASVRLSSGARSWRGSSVTREAAAAGLVERCVRSHRNTGRTR